MPRVAPFRGLRYDQAVAGPLTGLTAPPYDVISAPRRDRYLGSSPYNVVHLDLAEGGSDPSVPGNRYERAALLLQSWVADGALTPAEHPRYYAYEVTWPPGDYGAGSLRGILCALTLEPWGGLVVPHEHTMPGPIADRLELLRATRTHLSPIYGTVPGPVVPLAALLDATCESDPDEDLVDEEGVWHRLWELDGGLPIDAWLAAQELVIADGHHRYTTALAYRDERHAVEGPGPWDSILTFVVDSGSQEVPVLPYHRVQLAGGLPHPTRAVSGLAELESYVGDDAMTVGTIVRRRRGATYGLLTLHGVPPVVRALHEGFLDEHAPGDALRFTHSVADAEAAVLTGDAIAAYILPPTTPEHLRAAIHHGQRLPRKSTFFWPKPRTGMVFMPLDYGVVPPSASGS
jgi:uncharacterized protein (DUF1015 family)